VSSPRTVWLDFETFYSKEYSLSKMAPVEYVLDPRFICNGVAVIMDDYPQPLWFDDHQVPELFAALDPANTTIVTHNALFDMCITAWRYGFKPARMVCTLSMARAMLGHKLKRLSLSKVAEHLELGAKGDTLPKVIGMTLADIKANGLYDEYVNYAKDDVTLCRGIYQKLAPKFPESELEVMDSVLRCAIEPKLLLDQQKLLDHVANIRAEKSALLAECGADPEQLMSNTKFAELLRGLGVEPPMKTSIVTGKEAYAFAKTDQGMIDLAEHDDPNVQALVAARLGHKSTLEESRCQRFLNISNLTWPEGYRQGYMPVPLRYGGAHTHRLSGDWKLNMQNLPRASELRRALIAPPHHLVVAADASQIEARIVAWICGQTDLVAQFEAGEDVYSSFASDVFDRPVTKADKVERFLGKTCILGMGYGVGWVKFQSTVKVQSKLQLGTAVELDDGEATRIVSAYRRKYDRIPATWRMLNTTGIHVLSGASEQTFRLGPCMFGKGSVALPSGLELHYDNLRNENGEWRFDYAGQSVRLYGGKLLENIVQALARIIVMDAEVRIKNRLRRYGWGLALQAHDELVYVVPANVADVVQSLMLEEMARRPAWAPTLPLKAEAGIGPTYGDAK
jgi:hypothetical protein